MEPQREKGDGDVTTPTIVVVGDHVSLTGLVRRAAETSPVPPAVTRVEGYLSALGLVGATGRGLMPTALVGRVEDLNHGELEATAAALRLLAPDTRLVVVAPAHRQAQAQLAVASGFDQFLIEPVTPEHLAAAMGLGRATAAAPAERDATANARTDSMTRAPSAGLVDAADAAETMFAGQIAGASASALSATSAMPGVEASALGDTDLVEQLMRDPRQLRALALRMVGGRLGVEGVGLAGSALDVPAGRTACEVVFAGRSLGLMHAPGSVSGAALEPWAAWLARWLALAEQMTNLWDMALRDELTGAWNRRYFLRFLRNVLSRAANERFRVTVMVFDIDGFKSYNDRYGHAAGDEILRETARLMRSVVREHDVVARIGGDEFGVVFWDAHEPRQPGSNHPTDVRQAAIRFRQAVAAHKFPKLLKEAPGTLTISGGLASFPWDGRTSEELIELADAMALRSKRQGKNALTFGPGADRDA